MTDTEKNITYKNSLSYRTAMTITIAGAVFAIIILAALGLRYFRFAIILPLQENTLADIKVALTQTPESQELLEQFRALDLTTRKIRVQWYDFASRAGIAILFNFALFLTGAKWISYLRKKPPHPEPGIKYNERSIWRDITTRRATTGILVSLIAAATLLTLFWTPLEYLQNKQAETEVVSLPPFPSPEEIAVNWPRFRGPGGLGKSNSTNIPTNWDVETGENILWKTEIPLEGRNSPVVWNDKVFLTGATETQKQVYCYDTTTGQLLWTATVPDMGVSGSELDIYPDTGYAAPTAYTDGRRVYAIFPTGDIAAFDFKGQTVWARNIGQPDNIYGFATSLTGYEDKVLIQYDNGIEGDDLSWMIALNSATGQPVWRTPRTASNSWTTPIVIETETGPQIITCSDPFVIAYDPRTGSEIWRAECMSGELAPSPIFDNGLVMVSSPYTNMIAIDPAGTGTLDESFYKWQVENGIPDISSPVSDGQRVYLVGTYGGTLTVYDLQGQQLWQHNLGGEFNSSPTVIGNNIYLFSTEGLGVIFETADQYKEIGRFPLNEQVHCSPAVVGDRMFVRGEKHLFCIGTTE